MASAGKGSAKGRHAFSGPRRSGLLWECMCGSLSPDSCPQCQTCWAVAPTHILQMIVAPSGGLGAQDRRNSSKGKGKGKYHGAATPPGLGAYPQHGL